MFEGRGIMGRRRLIIVLAAFCAAGCMLTACGEDIGKINGVKVLKGIGGKHSLPEESHTSNVYIKLKPDGSFHEMRIYLNKNMSSTRNILRE